MPEVDMDHCPLCGAELDSAERFPPNEGSNRTDKPVHRYFHKHGQQFCERSISMETEQNGGGA